MKAKKISRQLKNSTGSAQRRTFILSTKMKRLDKVGGIQDARFGAHDKLKTDSEKSLQRHIVEKLRQLEKVSFEHDANDPINQAAFGPADKTKTGRQFLLDEHADSGLTGEIVDEEFFSQGSSAQRFKDTLSEKIAASKLEKLKRVEENEEQRKRVKSVDAEWSQKIRFMLSQLPPSKIAPVPKANKMNKSRQNRKSVSHLLEQIVGDKRVAPAEAKQESTDEKQLQNLQCVLEKHSVEGLVDPTNSSNQPTDEPQNKSVGYLLRLLLRMPEHENAVAAFIADQLQTAAFKDLRDVVHHLLLTQLMVEHCQLRIANYKDESVCSSQFASGGFCPEIVGLLTKMWQLTINTIGDSSSLVFPSIVDLKRINNERQINEVPYVDIKWTDPRVQLSSEQTVSAQLACLKRLIVLSNEVVLMYRGLVPGSVAELLFRPMRQAVLAHCPKSVPRVLQTDFGRLIDSFQSSCKPLVSKPLECDSRLTILSSEEPEDSKALKRLGLLPQLEPRFEDKLQVRPKEKVNVKRSLQRKIAREKRGTMRDIRRDGQFLAAHQLKVTKDSDTMRKQKTQEVLNSLRTIED